MIQVFLAFFIVTSMGRASPVAQIPVDSFEECHKMAQEYISKDVPEGAMYLAASCILQKSPVKKEDT